MCVTEQQEEEEEEEKKERGTAEGAFIFFYILKSFFPLSPFTDNYKVNYGDVRQTDGI